ncbi:hypothetical protein niasHS_002959 [Heterodera schachtii]|uniref:Hexosyltransferase n=2 Tax=Heterodera TaxID=34509 RepID=A0ABD2KAD6_HETSC
MAGKKLKPSSPLVSSSFRKKVSSSYYLRSNFVSAWIIRLFFLAFFVALLYLFIYEALFYYKKPQSVLLGRFLNDKIQFEIRFKNIRLPYSFRFLYEKPCPKPTKLLILVMTRRNAFIQRNSIRKTWASDALNDTVIRFLIGDAPKSDARNQKARDEQIKLELEFKKFGDLIFLNGITDNYQNLHLKWHAALEWQQNFCKNAEFLMKTDDDTIVHLPRLDRWIEHKFRPALKQNEATYFGWIISGVKPIRDKGHRWFVPKSAYPYEWYPAYMQGATYLASAQAISAVMRHVHEVNGFNMDDIVFTGILAKLANVTLFDSGAHFRVGNALHANEKCVDGIPEAVALYGADSLAQFEEIYDKLDAIECAKSKA